MLHRLCCAFQFSICACVCWFRVRCCLSCSLAAFRLHYTVGFASPKSGVFNVALPFSLAFYGFVFVFMFVLWFCVAEVVFGFPLRSCFVLYFYFCVLTNRFTECSYVL